MSSENKSSHPPLPELHEALLDSPILEQLFRDLDECAEIIEVIPKLAARSYAPQAVLTLEEGRALLLAGKLRALQIRYQYDNAEWWDTLMVQEGKVRLVRIQQNFEN